MKPMILHIPHAADHLPFLDGFVLPIDRLYAEMLLLNDWYTDLIFNSNNVNDIKLVAPFSRIFCDVERFDDDAKEVMAQYGMGVLYTHTDSGECMRVVSPELRESMIENYYRPHHLQLETAVNNQLEKYGSTLILDGHSFPSTPFKRELIKDGIRPDFCIGTDPFHTPEELIQISIDFFKKQSFSVLLNNPFAGCMVPAAHYQKQPGVFAIMLEINRSLYMNEQTGEKNNQFNQIKQITNDYVELLRQYMEQV